MAGRRSPLRAVEPGESAPEPRVLSVDKAAAEGSELELLMSMRDRVAVAVADPNCAARDLAALTRRLREITKDIDALRARQVEEALDAADAPDEQWNSEAI